VKDKVVVYSPRPFKLRRLAGISNMTIEIHTKLYEGYVAQTNLLNAQIAELIKGGEVDLDNLPAYSELTRRLGFEYNGKVLHELYFENLRPGGGTGEPAESSHFRQAAETCFASFDLWKANFVTVGKMRGVGWVICYQDPVNGRLTNHWISLHHNGNIAGFNPILVMDMWEHAYLLDYPPTERSKYIEAFFSNVDWDTVEGRITSGFSSRQIPAGPKSPDRSKQSERGVAALPAAQSATKSEPVGKAGSGRSAL
jgi:Fe-Mn family superoxide dismutase